MEKLKELWKVLVENAGFVAVCFGIMAGLYAIARIFEHFCQNKRQVSPARRITIVAICGALASLLMLLEIPMPFLAPGFYKLDLSEVPVLLCGFFLGPSAAVACEGVKIFINLVFDGTTTAFVGEFANFTVGCLLVLPASMYYRRQSTKKGALTACFLGTGSTTVLGSAFNAFYLLPKFAQLYGIPLEKIISMGTAINPAITDVKSFVLFAVAPLNLIKGLVVSLFTVLLYKKVARPLFGTGRK